MWPTNPVRTRTNLRHFCEVLESGKESEFSGFEEEELQRHLCYQTPFHDEGQSIEQRIQFENCKSHDCDESRRPYTKSFYRHDELFGYSPGIE